MSRGRGRAGPSDPQDILRRNAEARAAARRVDADPSLWGVSAQIFRLPTAADVELNLDQQGKVLAANRSDPFDLLHKAGGLRDGQHRAARRLFRDWCLRAGVQDGERQVIAEKIDGGRADPAGRVNQVMIDAGGRIAKAMEGIGPVNAKLLCELISPMVDRGQVIAWRGTVQRVTGEKDRNAQGALVRQACEALRLVYEKVDEEKRRVDSEARAPADLRPFGTFRESAA